MKDSKKIGLCFSGGGYRAAAYHIGTLRKLEEMNILDKIDFISANSGGSITAATYCLNKSNLKQFETIMLKGLKKNMLLRIIFSIRFLAAVIFLIVITFFLFKYLGGFVALFSLLMLLGFMQFQLFPFSKMNEISYRKIFVKKSTLKDLPKSPTLIINSTNAETGRPFIFATNKMGDSSYEYPEDGSKEITFKHEKFPIAKAVAASTCVPFAFTPVRISSIFFSDPNDSKKAQPRLIDGGVYDNQGVHKLAHSRSSYACDVIIVSDAGDKMPFRNTYKNILALLIRVSDIFMNRIKNIQMIDLLYDSIENKSREVAYQSLGWDLDKSIDEFIRSLKNNQILNRVWEMHGITQMDIDKKDWGVVEGKLKSSIGYDKMLSAYNSGGNIKLARSVGTNLVSLSDKKVDALIHHAYYMTEIQIKLYCPILIK